MNSEPKDLSPRDVFTQVAAAVPPELHANIVIIGSLAAAYAFTEVRRDTTMRTKDVDCVLAPHITAVEHGRRITALLLASGWRPRTSGAFGQPADAQTPDQQLPAVRLYPPSHDDWFLEMLTEPASDAQRGIRWDRVALSSGEHFGLPSFEFTGISTFDPATSREGLRYARPECMALAHLLEHRAFSDQPISGTDFGGRPLLRRNKDLGRVLAIATLAGSAGVRHWPAQWSAALDGRLPKRRQELARTVGDGIRKLLASQTDLQEAVVHVNRGLLSQDPVSSDDLRATGELVVRAAVQPLEQAVG